jgi:hypothetical protein
VEVEWDPIKDHENQEKHGLSFEEAAALFASDDDYLEIYDDEHSDDEERFIAIGMVVQGIIVVVWTERSEDVVRIISARPATKHEIELFHHYRDRS